MARSVRGEAKAGLPADTCHLLGIFKRQHDRRCQPRLLRADLELGHESICHVDTQVRPGMGN